MSTPSPPDPISAHHVLEEANKTSWVSPSYPTPAITRMEMDAMPNTDIDTNRKLGRDLETDELEFAQYYDWSTWKEPKIEWAYFHQFDEASGIRVAVHLTGGDPWRTLVNFIIRKDDPETGEVVASSNTRYAGEFNSDSSDPKIQYSWSQHNGPKNVHAAIFSAWTDVDVFGDYVYDEVTPGSAQLIDPTSGDHTPETIMTFVDNTLTVDSGHVDGTTVYYLTVRLYDGRHNDSLPDPPSSGDYDTSNNEIISLSGVEQGIEYNVVNDQDPLYPPGHGLFDAEAGDGGIILFSGLGNVIIDGKDNENVTCSTENFYSYYLDGGLQYFWLYVTDNTLDAQEPYFPDDGEDIPDGHPYDNPDNDDFENEHFQLNKWIRFQGQPFHVTGLSPGISYNIYVLPFEESDIDRYPDPSLAGGISAPANDRSKSDIPSANVTTETNALSAPFIDGGSANSTDFILDWLDANGENADDYDILYGEKPNSQEDPLDWYDHQNDDRVFFNEGFWDVESGWGTSTIDRNGNVFKRLVGSTSGETWQIKIRARSDESFLPSDYSNTFEVTVP